MAEHVCPWWAGYVLLLPLRRLAYDPRRILPPFVREGMTILEPGPGMGYFTLELARLAGPAGRVVAVDIQARMLERLKRRAARRGLDARIDVRLAPPSTMPLGDLRGQVDLVWAFFVVHEMPDVPAFFRQAAGALKPGGHLLFAEPSGNHVPPPQFDAEVQAAADAGLKPVDRPRIRMSQTVLFAK